MNRQKIIHYSNLKAFTLAELIVVMTIIVILSTMGFISYSSYLIGVRDSVRITQLESVNEGLEIYGVTNTIPLPDNYVEILSDSGVIAFQGEAGLNVLETINFTNQGKDPKYGTYLSYYLTKDRKSFQLMTLLENNVLVMNNNGISKSFADVNYKNSYIKVYGDKLGILTGQGEFENVPVNNIDTLIYSGAIDLSGTHSGTTFQANFSNDDIIIASGDSLRYDLLSVTNSQYLAPEDCVDGYIPVPGDALFQQKGFCVSKYEMTYSQPDSPVSPDSTDGGSDWNSYAYNSSKSIRSRIDYPISSLTQNEAILACQSIGSGYHLITNNEWMTLARNISKQEANWSNGLVGSGSIYNGNSGDNTLGCTDSAGGRTYGAKTGGIENTNLDSVRSTCDEKKQLLLSNGVIIWDFAGNLSEHVNKANNVHGLGYNTGVVSLTNGTGYKEWNHAAIDGNERLLYGPPDSTYISSFGMGDVYDVTGVSTDNVFVRGGNANDLIHAGIFNLDLTNTDIDSSKNIGFRCTK